jgi:hypothetical protein
MTTVPDPTVQTPTEWTQEFDAPPNPTPGPTSVRGPAATHATAVRPEDPKRNPVTYVALAIALLALLLSLVALTRDSGPDQIDVGGKRCIVQHIDGNDANTLFCQT